MFEHSKTKTTMELPLPNGSVYAFGNTFNEEYRHGIKAVKDEEYKKAIRVSIIIWGKVTNVK